jgi:hypothetical protein
MKYKVLTSLDFGSTYNITGFGDIKELEEIVKDTKDRRWVILDENDNIMKCCYYIEAMVEAAKPDTKIATDDPYVTELILKKGGQVITSRDMFIMMGGNVEEYDKKTKTPPTRQQIKEAALTIQEMIADGTIEVLKK